MDSDGILFEIKRAEPNAVTKAALAEYEEMRKNPGAYKRYQSFDELLNEVLQDVLEFLPEGAPTFFHSL